MWGDGPGWECSVRREVVEKRMFDAYNCVTTRALRFGAPVEIQDVVECSALAKGSVVRGGGWWARIPVGPIDRGRKEL